MTRCLIVAVADDGAIGRGGDMPWHISEDLKYFKRTTLGSPVIMGRVTYESLGRPLPGRRNIVVSRRGFIDQRVEVAGSLEAAFALVEGSEKCFVIGGARLYREAVEVVDRMYITRVHARVEGADAFFPEFATEEWSLESRSETLTDPETLWKYEFEVYTRLEKA